MSESPEDRLKRLAIETGQVRDLERQLDEYKENNKLRLAVGQSITPAREAEGEEVRNKLDEARQRLYYSLLTSISESSAHMDAATKSLQKSSEAQLKVAESQAEAINNLLKSSRTH
jgi:predicted HAD superfamily phosphohydrolase